MKESPMEDAKTYISKRQIPQLFESLMTGLMFHRPNDHLSFLVDCINKVKESGKNVLQWDSFVELKKSPLPPISSTTPNGKAENDDSVEDAKALLDAWDPEALPDRASSGKSMSKSSPLPPISSKQTEAKIPSNIPVVLIMGGPGSGKLTQCTKIVDKYKQHKWVHISIGDLLRQEIVKKGNAGKKWSMIGDLVQQGELAPQEVTESLIRKSLSQHQGAGGFLIEGYPRTMDQVDEYEKVVKRVDLVILLDCEEELCRDRLLARGDAKQRIDDNETAIQRRIDYFKQNTIPVANHFDKLGKLVAISGDRDTDEIFYDIANIMDVAFFGRKPESVVMQQPAVNRLPQSIKSGNKSPRRRSVIPVKSFLLSAPDKGRKSGLPSAPIIFIMGGPGCGKGTQCSRLVGRFPNFVHLSMGDILREEISKHGTSDEKWSMVLELISKGEMAPQEVIKDLLVSNLKDHQNAKGFIIEGYPRDKNQLEDFNNLVGGLTLAVLLDCNEEALYKYVENRRAKSGRPDDQPAALEKRIEFYKTHTLPVAKYLDDISKLSVVAGDRSMEDVHYDLASIFNYLLYKNLQNTPNLSNLSKDSKESTLQAAVEEEIEPVVAHTTGGDKSKESTSASLTKSEGSAAGSETAGKQSGEPSAASLKKENTTASSQAKPSRENSAASNKSVTKRSHERLDMSDVKDKKVVFVIGGPGCGKGTQCAKIVEKYGFCHLSTGDLLRDEVASGSERGKELTATMAAGQLVSLDVVLLLLKEAMLKNSNAKGFLIDGYPRDLEQGIKFEADLVEPKVVLYFEVPDEVMVERLLERAKTSGRVDDNEETIKKRLATFHTHSDDVVKRYEEKGLLCKLDARGKVDEIFEGVAKKLDTI